MLVRILRIVPCLLLVSPTVLAQQGTSDLLLQGTINVGAGWAGFVDFHFILDALLTLLLSTALGSVIAFHPKLAQTADTLEELDARKVYILYAVIGALIGILVVNYGLVVGFVLFGIGGLIRFRTVLGSAVMTGQVIFATLIGLSCGLDLPHVGVLATIFGFILLYFLDAQIIYRAEIRGLPPDRFFESTAAYREALEKCGCTVVREQKNPEKQRLSFIFRGRKHQTRAELEREIDALIESTLRGTIDWNLN